MQTLCAGLGLAALLASLGADGAAWVALALAGAALGFLHHNWQPARTGEWSLSDVWLEAR